MSMTATEFPTLYKLTSTGKVQTWKIEVHEPTANWPGGWIVTTYGLLDGKKQIAEEYVDQGKNIGKANETTAYEQAILEAKSQWEKKSKKGYVQNIEDAQEKKVDTSFVAGGIVPMLAHTFDKQGHKIKFPAFAQPKLDGHRCIAMIEGENVTLWSRTQKRIYSMPHIEKQLAGLFGDERVILDGELYNHEYKDNFEELSSKIRQSGPVPGHEVVQFWVFDVVVDGGFNARNLILKNLDMAVRELHRNSIVVVPTETVSDQEEMDAVFSVFLDAGFEGLMLRNATGNYKHGRSYDLQKVKVFMDEEFPVVDIDSGKGKMDGKAMFICGLPNGETFRVKMVGEIDKLAHYLEHKEDYIGKDLTVKFQGYSAYGVPRFPVALRFHDPL